MIQDLLNDAVIEVEIPNSSEEAYRKILENYPKQPLELKRNPFNELHPKDQQLLREQYEKIFGN